MRVARTVLFVSVLLTNASCVRHPGQSVLAPRTNVGPGGGVDLVPQMQLRVENAYYRQGALRGGSEGFIGTEIAHFQVVARGGLLLVSAQSTLTERRGGLPPVRNLIRRSQLRYRYHRFFHAVVFNQNGRRQGSVLLGARTMDELDQLGQQFLTAPDIVCGDRSRQCSVFPEACTVSVDIEIVVNGVARTVLWGSRISSVSPGARHIELSRLSGGRLTSVEIDPRASDTSLLPLLPGDQVKWD
jgi:hypothetical protein